MVKILHIAPDFDFDSGVATHITMLLRRFSQNPGYEMHFMTNGGSALERLNGMPVKLVLIRMRKGLANVVHLNSNVRFISEYCLEHKIDIIHTHHRYPEFAAYLVSKKIKVATLTTAHSLVTGFRLVSFKSDRIIAVSEAVRRHIVRKYNVAQSKIRMLHNSVEPPPRLTGQEIDSLRSSLGIRADHTVVLFVGRIIAEKGVRTLIEAFQKVRRVRKDLTLLMVGHGLLLRHRWGSEGTERILVLPPRDGVHEYYQLADIVVLPSEAESFPYVMLEAGLAGTAFIGTRVGGIAEFITDGKDGLLFAPGDEGALSQLLCSLIDDPAAGAALGRNLGEKVASLPSCDEYCDTLQSIYTELIRSQ
jgi:glycosyltransferase involved in cell wall biosynthesis